MLKRRACRQAERNTTSRGQERLRSSATYPWTRPLFCSCWSRMFSSLRGLGMKPISQPSFTSRPIHQSLLNFCGKKEKKKNSTRTKIGHCKGIKSTNLFYVEEVLGVEGDGCGWDRNVFIQCAAVADVGPHGEGHRFGLRDGITARIQRR